MTRKKVQLFNQARGVEVDTAATNGAVVGLNLFWGDGRLVDLSALVQQPGDGGETYPFWRTIQEVPPNVVALAETITAGIYVITDEGESATRSIDVEAGELTVSSADGVAGNPVLGLADVPDTGGGTLQRTEFDAKGRKTGTSAATTDDLEEGSANLYFTNARADARITAAKAAPDGIASLIDGKLDPGQLPPLAITETFVVNTQAAMLALDAQQGDVAVRSDEQKSYILTADPASALSNWQELLVPTGVGVASFNGRTGSVVPASGDYTAAQVGADPAGTAASAVSAHEAASDPHPQYTTASEAAAAAPVQSVNGKQGAVVLDAADVGAVNKNGDTVTGNLFVVGRVQSQGANARTAFADRITGQSWGWYGSNGIAYLWSGSSDVMEIASSGNVAFYGNVLFRSPNAFMQSDSNAKRIAMIAGTSLSANSGAFFLAHGTGHPTFPGLMQIAAGSGGNIMLSPAAGMGVIPQTDNNRNLGGASNRWSVIYAGTGSINTSDAREKTAPRDLTGAELAAAADIARLPSIYQWLAAIEEKGAAARLHCSPTVQSVVAVMESHGLDPFRYGFVCFDAWDEQPEIRDEETGEVTQECRPAGDRYSLRPTELAHFVMRGLAHRQDDLERRLAAAGL